MIFRRIFPGGMAHLPNVRLFDFRSLKEVTHNLNNYSDVIYQSPDVDLKVLAWLAPGNYLLQLRRSTASLDLLKAQVAAYRVDRDRSANDRHCKERSDEAIHPLSFRDGALAPDPESRYFGFNAAHRPRNGRRFLIPYPRPRIRTEHRNLGSTASTTAKVITSIAMPSTAMAPRSPLSLRSKIRTEDDLGLRGEQDDGGGKLADHADEDEAPGRDHAGAQQAAR